MTIHAYQLQQMGPRPIRDVIRHLEQQTLPQRVMAAVGDGFRLEASRLDGAILKLDFAVVRNGHGPGKISRARPIEPIDLAQDEGFGEDTAMLIDTRSNQAVVQFNQHGPRVSRIAIYLCSVDETIGGLRPAAAGEVLEDRCGFRFGILLQPDVRRKFQRMGVISRIEAEVAVAAARATVDAGNSLNQFLNAPVPAGVERLTLTLAPEPRRTLAVQGAKRWVRDLLRLGDDAVKGVKVWGADNDEERVEPIDLMSQKLVARVPLNLGRGGRYTRVDRWAALFGQFERWRAEQALPAAG